MKQLLTRIISEVFSSPDMRDYLIDHVNNLTKDQIVNMINGALISLERKLKMFTELAGLDDGDATFNKARDKLIVAMEILQNSHKGEGILLLTQYEQRNGTVSVVENMPFYAYEKLVCHLKKTMHRDGADKKILGNRWYIIEKYVNDMNDGMVKSNIYIGVRGGLCFCLPCKNGSSIFADVCRCGNLKLPIPFKMGDILFIEREPFGESPKALVLGVNDNDTNCCVTVLYVGDTGRLELAELNRGDQLCESEFPFPVSPLYSARLYQRELKGDNAVLVKIQTFIGLDGVEVNKIYSMEGMYANEITQEFLEEYKKER